LTNSHHKKEVHIIGGGLFGCLLAYQLSKKNYKISIFERSNELLNSFNSIELNKIKLNNGFHGIEFPRAKKLYNFFRDKLKVKFNTFEINRKIIFKKYIINYTDKKSEWPNQISSYLKNTNVPYKNQKINFFFQKKIINLFKQNSLKYTNNTINDKSFFLPWFLPADIKHLSNDEGDKFRSLIRTKKIRGKVTHSLLSLSFQS
jgi:protoporphyrinogen oxidase